MGIAQQQFEINEQNIKKLMELTGQGFRQCQRKAYDVAACRVNEDIYFANRLTHPISYQAIVKATHGKPLIARAEAEKDAALMTVLRENGCGTYKGGEYRALMCGTYGELSILYSYDLDNNYIFGDDLVIDMENLYPRWNLLHCRGESKPTAVGIQLPVQYLGIYKTYDDTKYANNPTELGHGSGDILVIPLRDVRYITGVTRTIYDYNHIEIVNNAIFARTYNQNIGGWGKSGLITEESKMTMPSIEQLNNCINKSKGITFSKTACPIRNEPVEYTCKFSVTGKYKTVISKSCYDGDTYADLDLGFSDIGEVDEYEISDNIDWDGDVEYDDEDEHRRYPYYHVTLEISGYITTTVMARTEAEAIKLACDYIKNKANTGDLVITDYELEDCEVEDESADD